MKKVYKVNFISYTNACYDTVSDYQDDLYKDLFESGPNYIKAPKDEFLVVEDDLNDLISFGRGIDTIKFVGYLFDGKLVGGEDLKSKGE